MRAGALSETPTSTGPKHDARVYRLRRHVRRVLAGAVPAIAISPSSGRNTFVWTGVVMVVNMKLIGWKMGLCIIPICLASCFGNQWEGCVSKDDWCHHDSDCYVGYVCEDQLWGGRSCIKATECTTNEDCIEGESCQARPNSPPGQPFESSEPGKTVCGVNLECVINAASGGCDAGGLGGAGGAGGLGGAGGAGGLGGVGGAGGLGGASASGGAGGVGGVGGGGGAGEMGGAGSGGGT
jgi:hypothetical protein